MPNLETYEESNKFYRLYGKRFFDLIISVALIVILCPIYILLALLIKRRFGSPILFKQQRPGIHRKPFVIYKFRTMTDRTNARGEVLPDNQRLTPLGKFLRSTSLDEIPELFNVVKGEMSIVGPRPLLMKYLPYYTQDELLRFSVRPGITGLAQISGRNDLPWNDRLSKDVHYVKEQSFLLDLKIICLTFLSTLSQKGVKVDPASAMLDLDVERQRWRNG